ncbi:MAG: HlyD family secretion protein [Lacipirellulaceae bacterium]
MLSSVAYREEEFPALRLTRSSRVARRIARWLTGLMLVGVLAMLLLPWQQSIVGDGSVVAFDPLSRPQPVLIPVKGQVAARAPNVFENTEVKKGQLLFRITDLDANYLPRLGEQRAMLERELFAAKDRELRALDAKEFAIRTVQTTTEELESTKAAQTEVVAAYNALVMGAENKLRAEEAAAIAAQAELDLTQADSERKNTLEAGGLKSQYDRQQAEAKFRKSQQELEKAQQYVEAARNEIEGKTREREGKRKEWQAKIDKISSDLNKAQSEVQKAESGILKTKQEIQQKTLKISEQDGKIAAQSTQDVLAPCDGYINSLSVFEGQIVAAKDQACVVVPKTEDFAVQLWIDGNDVPFIEPGRHVRLQFEGWPAVQFSGWPAIAVGTFGGTVAIVDPTDDGSGRFRILIRPDVAVDSNDPTATPWPSSKYLRQGGLAKGWVLLDTVPLGYEVWRRMNGFPPALKNRDQSKPEKIAKPPKVG